MPVLELVPQRWLPVLHDWNHYSGHLDQQQVDRWLDLLRHLSCRLLLQWISGLQGKPPVHAGCGVCDPRRPVHGTVEQDQWILCGHNMRMVLEYLWAEVESIKGKILFVGQRWHGNWSSLWSSSSHATPSGCWVCFRCSSSCSFGHRIRFRCWPPWCTLALVRSFGPPRSAGLFSAVQRSPRASLRWS